MLKLNIGCGSNHLPGYLNIDSFSGCAPDKLLDLEQVPWDFDDNSVDEIVATHVLEHLGQQTSVFFGVIKELYRVLCHGGQAHIAVPHHFHPTFFGDPTHVRAFTRTTFEMLDRKKNLDWVARKVNVTPLALMLDVDFEIINATQHYDPAWIKHRQNGQYTQEQL